MLLQHRLNEIQSVISGYQSQIDELNTKISALQSHAQKVLSVEQAMESAVTQIQNAIAMIHQVCPDELPDFKDVINSQFGDAPIAELPPVSPTEVSNTPEPDAPTNPPSDTTEPSTVYVEVTDNEQVKAKNTADQKPEWHGLTWQKFVSYAKSQGINVKGKTRAEIELELLAKSQK